MVEENFLIFSEPLQSFREHMIAAYAIMNFSKVPAGYLLFPSTAKQLGILVTKECGLAVDYNTSIQIFYSTSMMIKGQFEAP